MKSPSTARHTVLLGKIAVTATHTPKDELALVAESLVQVTSFRQRIAQEVETVGGPKRKSN